MQQKSEDIKVSLKGLLKKIKLPKSKNLIPLFEAINNSIDSIDELQNNNGTVIIDVEREDNESPLSKIKNFSISDNGIGFTDENFESFKTVDSAKKLENGGKGVGRLSWIIAFDKCKIESVHGHNGNLNKRIFLFNKNGIENHHNSSGICENQKTIILLENFKDSFKNECVKTLETLARKIIYHFLLFFLDGKIPKIILKDKLNEINLNDEYIRIIDNHNITDDNVKIDGFSFKIRHTKLYNSSEDKNGISFCANNREVKRINLSVPHVENKKITESSSGKTYYYVVYVSGDYLDNCVNDRRTDFDLGDDDKLLENLTKEINEKASIFIEKDIRSYKEENFKKYQEYIFTKSPQYRYLVDFRRKEIENLPCGLKDEDLEIKLLEIKGHWVIETREKTKKIRSIEDREKRKAEYLKHLREENQVGASDLCEYVIHRKMVLDVIKEFLEIQDGNQYKKEREIHEIIFPLSTTSNDLPYDQQNLWVIDEKLSYHHYLSSDKKLSNLEVIESECNNRPDILIFDTPIACVDDNKQPYNSIVIIEFKRPGEENPKNPILQVKDYMDEIKKSKVKDKSGRLINITKSTQFFCYIICELSEKMRKNANSENLTESPDKLGYFGFHNYYNAYIEIISFDKLYQDAEQRNKVLFDKLNLL